MKRELKEGISLCVLGKTLDILFTILHGAIISFIVKLCWNVLANKFGIPKFTYVETVAIYGLAFCILRTIKWNLSCRKRGEKNDFS